MAGGALDLDDGAQVQLVVAAPPLQAADWAELADRLERRFAQFLAQGRIRAHAIELVAGGAAVLLAWEGDGPLSGCSRDALVRELLLTEERGTRLVNAPPLLVEVAGRPRAMGRAELRALLASGQLDAGSAWYDLRVETLGDWRRHGRIRLDEAPLGRQLLAERLRA